MAPNHYLKQCWLTSRAEMIQQAHDTIRFMVWCTWYDTFHDTFVIPYNDIYCSLHICTIPVCWCIVWVLLPSVVLGCAHLTAISLCMLKFLFCIIIPPASTKLKGGYTGFTLSVRLSICLSVRLWTESCSLCIFNNTHRIHFIFAHIIKQLQKVCGM